jgi:hypothetical protein
MEHEAKGVRAASDGRFRVFKIGDAADLGTRTILGCGMNRFHWKSTFC